MIRLPDGKLINQVGRLFYGNSSNQVNEINYLTNKTVTHKQARHKIPLQSITGGSTITLNSTTFPDYYTYQAFYCRAITVQMYGCTVGDSYKFILKLGTLQNSEIWLNYTPTGTNGQIQLSMCSIPVFPTYIGAHCSICFYTVFGSTSIATVPTEEQTGIVLIDSYVPWTYELQFPTNVSIRVGMSSLYTVDWYKIA